MKKRVLSCSRAQIYMLLLLCCAPNSPKFIPHKHTTFKQFELPWSWAHLYDWYWGWPYSSMWEIELNTWSQWTKKLELACIQISDWQYAYSKERKDLRKSGHGLDRKQIQMEGSRKKKYSTWGTIVFTRGLPPHYWNLRHFTVVESVTDTWGYNAAVLYSPYNIWDLAGDSHSTAETDRAYSLLSCDNPLRFSDPPQFNTCLTPEPPRAHINFRLFWQTKMTPLTTSPALWLS